MGTPKTLDEAIAIALCTCSGPDPVGTFHSIIKDFLAQKFGAAMLGNVEQGDELKKLFEDCTNKRTA